MASSEAKNLEAIKKAIDQHDANCGQPAIEIAMNPFEVERLGWEELWGLPVVGDDKIGTGRFEIRCERDKTGDNQAVHDSLKVPAGVVD
jgi:hypothetical protein